MAEYMIVHATAIQALEASVQKYLADGWQLQGGVSVIDEGAKQWHVKTIASLRARQRTGLTCWVCQVYNSLCFGGRCNLSNEASMFLRRVWP